MEYEGLGGKSCLGTRKRLEMCGTDGACWERGVYRGNNVGCCDGGRKREGNKCVK